MDVANRYDEEAHLAEGAHAHAQPHEAPEPYHQEPYDPVDTGNHFDAGGQLAGGECLDEFSEFAPVRMY